jgi:TolB-like protein/Flp pilus assembly protein TadD/predicted Ser/Thr protein kinase
MIGRTISHYTILEKLGEGGMGVVYKARDLMLDRIVALKFLPPHLDADDTDGARLLQEARAASGLNHPGICTIHAIGEHEGARFIDLEYVDGRTMGEVIRQGPLPVAQAVEYGIQICEAVQEAHANGIVHRDIKADNVMVAARDRIKVMDFGLAKLKGSPGITRPLSTIGTLAYMAPEQLQGREADARSDIFSLGVLLYEMLSGRLPFRGEHEAAVLYSIAHESPEPLSRVRSGIPKEIERIVSRALEKDPAARYQAAAEVAGDLRRAAAHLAPEGETPHDLPPAKTHVDPQAISPGATAAPNVRPAIRRASRSRVLIVAMLAVVIIGFVLYRWNPFGGARVAGGRRMLAVLPFENLGAPERDYFADGITEEITSKLSGLSGLGVIARSSALQYRKTTKTVHQIGDELGVQYVLQGTIRWEDAGGTSRVRVTPQLISVADGTQLWSRSSEAVMSGVFTIQSDIAAQVADALDLTLLQPERRQLESKLTNNPDAYDSYLRGIEFQHRSNDERDYLAAEEMFRKAVSLDPGFAMAYARLSGIHSAIYWEYYDRTEDRVRKAKETAEKALALDPALPEAHAAMGFYFYHCLRDYESARREFDRGVAVQPDAEDLLLGLGAVDRRIGRWDDALSNIEKSLLGDPRTPVLLYEMSETLIPMRRYAEAEKYLDRAIQISPPWGDPYFRKAYLCLLRDGNAARGREILTEAVSRKVEGAVAWSVYYSVIVEECAGRFQEALDKLSGQGVSLFAAQEQYIPKDLFQARLLGFLNRPKEAAAHYEAARILLEGVAAAHADDSRFHSALGIVYAGLGRKEEALREGKAGTDLLPVSRDAMIGPLRVRDLAEILTMVGEKRAAVEKLGYLLSIESEISVPFLRVDPAWDPLRRETDFQKLVAAGPPADK